MRSRSLVRWLALLRNVALNVRDEFGIGGDACSATRLTSPLLVTAWIPLPPFAPYYENGREYQSEGRLTEEKSAVTSPDHQKSQPVPLGEEKRDSRMSRLSPESWLV